MEHQSPVAVKQVWRLVKWEGEPVETDTPEHCPECLEILEGGDDIPTRLIYRRD